MSTTTIIDFAEMLRESLEAKINEFRVDMRGSYKGYLKLIVWFY